MRKMHDQPPSLRSVLPVATFLALWAAFARAQPVEAPRTEAASTAVATNPQDRVEITGRHYDNAVGSRTPPRRVSSAPNCSRAAPRCARAKCSSSCPA